MMNLVRGPTYTSKFVTCALGVASVALAGGVIAKACFVIVADGGSLLNIFGAFVICAVIGAVTSAVRGVLGHPFSLLDFAVAGGDIVTGVVIGALIGSAHDGESLFGGLVGGTTGICVAFGGILA